MTGWTKAERDAELRRRTKADLLIDKQRDADARNAMRANADSNCVHCGMPYASYGSSGAEFGLCQDCVDRD